MCFFNYSDISRKIEQSENRGVDISSGIIAATLLIVTFLSIALIILAYVK